MLKFSPCHVLHREKKDMLFNEHFELLAELILSSKADIQYNLNVAAIK